MLTWDGKEIEIVRYGTIQCCIQYTKLFTKLHRSERQFYVPTAELEAQNTEIPDLRSKAGV